MKYDDHNVDLAALWLDIAADDRGSIRVHCEMRNRVVKLRYGKLVTAGCLAAELLQARGVRPRQRVLLCGQNSPEFVLAWVGLSLLGAVPVPLPPSVTMAGDDSFANRVAPLLPHHQHFVCRREDRDRCSGCAGADAVEFIDICAAMGPLIEGLERGQPVLQGALDSRLELLHTLGADDEAFIQYTSGSTSTPKGIVVSYRNILANTTAIHRGNGAVAGRDCYLTWLPVYHDYGLVGNFLSALFNRVNLVMVPPIYFVKRPLRFMALVVEYRANFMCMPNFGLEMILKALEIKGAAPGSLDLSSLRWWSVGAEPVSADTLERVSEQLAPFGLGAGVLSPSYGLAEATVGVSISLPGELHRIHHIGDRRLVGNGPLMDGFEMQLRDLDSSGAGRLFLRGDSMARHAYIDGVKQRICDDGGYVDTKDIACLRDGELLVCGRADEMFTIRGENYFPYDIENVVRRVSPLGARRVACFGVCREDGSGPRVVVLYESKNTGREFHLGMQSRLRELIISQTGLPVDEIYAVPARSIPVTTSGKVQRKRAANLYRQGHFARAAIVCDATA
ncbi:AMP-binding protein [Microbulbifer rhizosphaerae]|uniref:Acyl-CoA synthetase (AMP-forming)/AMP-acid ligase II n=1 Tax=Microbulbifer rhizosphaerae TaxID=1562603 RepID=A0A7W4ZB54_9GAMM|nr:AMP-binding protein [Microbulbifer rhizosphaerae]MBB3061930.1 acyl-CoA synthetase (AMP-forming)/AMP-acid ligase II [Microbulbifer rhizosphaerae]